MANLTNSDSWYPRCRLAWLERRAKERGSINRSDLIAEFGISPAQASSDLQTYHRLNPQALLYDLSSKRYQWRPEATLAITPVPWAGFPVDHGSLPA